MNEIKFDRNRIGVVTFNGVQHISLAELVKMILGNKKEEALRLNTFKEGYKAGYNDALDDLIKNFIHASQESN